MYIYHQCIRRYGQSYNIQYLTVNKVKCEGQGEDMTQGKGPVTITTRLSFIIKFNANFQYFNRLCCSEN